MSNWLDIVKTAGTAVLSSNPAGAAALTLINAFLPDDKKLGDSATGEQVSSAYQGLSPDAQLTLSTAKINQAIEEDKGRTARYVAMCQADGQETRAKIVKWAMIALIAISLIFIAAVAYVYMTAGAAVAFSADMAFVFLTVTGTFAYVIRAYFGDLRTETESRHVTVDDKPRLAKGVAGVIQSFRAGK